MNIITFTPEELLQHDQSLIEQTVKETLRQMNTATEVYDTTPVSLSALADQNGYKIDTYRRMAKEMKIPTIGRPLKIERRYIKHFPAKKSA